MPIKEDRAAYRILAPNGFFGPDDHLYIETAESGPVNIYFDGEPNEDMEPLNELARQRMEAYLEKLDQLGREVSLKTGKAYAGRPRTIDGALELATAVQRQLASEMGVKRDEVTNIERIVDNKPVQDTGITSVNRPRGRPKGSTKTPHASLSIEAA